MTMAPARDFFEIVKDQCDKSRSFRIGLLREAMDSFMTDDAAGGQVILRDLVKATLGFEELARRLDMQSSSLKRMLGPNGNPTSSNLSAIVNELQRNEGVVLSVVEKRVKKNRSPEPA